MTDSDPAINPNSIAAFGAGMDSTASALKVVTSAFGKGAPEADSTATKALKSGSTNELHSVRLGSSFGSSTESSSAVGVNSMKDSARDSATKGIPNRNKGKLKSVHHTHTVTSDSGGPRIHELKASDLAAVDMGKGPKKISKDKHAQKHFVNNFKSAPDFSFRIQIGSKDYSVSGIGVNSEGKIRATGAYGRVFFGTDENGKKVALKAVLKKPDQDFGDLVREATLLREVDGCKNVVGCSEAASLRLNSGAELMFMVMDHIENSSELYDVHLAHIGSKLGEFNALPNMKQRFEIADQLGEGLKEMHDLGIIHRDLKPENALIVPPKEADGEWEAKLIDLGFSRHVSDDESSCQGSPVFMSPEAMYGEVQGKPSDVCSYGLMLIEILTNGGVESPGWERLYDGKYESDNDGPVKFTKLPDSLREDLVRVLGSVEFVDDFEKLILPCFADNPAERPDIRTVLAGLAKLKQKYAV